MILLVALIGLGTLRLPSAPPSSVTVSQVDWTILEGTTSTGHGWFGPGSFNSTVSDGFPLTVAAGGSFVVAWAPVNLDVSPHTVSYASVNAPFTVDGTAPGLPCTVPVGDDPTPFGFTIGVPTSASGAYVLDITLNTS